MAVSSTQRFTQQRPCPVCGGWDHVPRGKGIRCYGFLSDDGAFANCTRPEHADGLQQNPSSETYAHRLQGICGCGNLHSPAPMSMNGHKPEQGQIVAVYDYCDFEVVRFEPKGFAQRRKDGQWGLGNVTPHLYRRPELLAADPQDVVLIPEGEKDVESGRSLGYVATCNPMGAGKWRESYSKDLAGRHVVVIPDNDDPGQRHAQQVAASVHHRAASVRMLKLPEGKDLSDWLALGHTREELEALIETARLWQAQDLSDDGERPRSLPLYELSDITPQHVRWLWPGRIAMGKLNLLVGDPGVGKSFITLDVAARVSLGGPWPDGGDAIEGNVILVTAEDGIADTVRPRLDALGANVSRIKVLGLSVIEQNGRETGLDLSQHLDLIEGHVITHRAVLIIIDPVLAFTGRVDTHNNAQVRGLLTPLAALAERTGAAVWGVMHLNKSADTNPQYRITSSLAFVAAARTAHLVASDPGNPERRLFVPIKNNLTAPSLSLAFHFSLDGVLAWDGPVEGVDVAWLLAPASGWEGGKVNEACSFLLTVLADGPRKVIEAKQEARDLGISKTTLRRAGDRLGIVPHRHSEGSSGDGYWTWELPQDAHPLRPSSEHVANKAATRNAVDTIPQDAQVLTGSDGHLASEEEAEWTG
ncbi:MAG: AAA family ATPase [Dehalococcoidia bacterium]|nr:AAA family ATPase [Dehalococcoidia bacterium]